MKTLFICLANSKKFGERCIAGIEVRKTGSTYYPIEKERKPRWIRPISKNQSGAVGEDIVGAINLTDIIEIEIEEFCPNGYQCENVTFEPSSIKKVGNLKISDANLDRLIDMERHNLFGNKGRAVSDDVIDSVEYSLTLIKVVDFEVIRKDSDGQIRMMFEFNYDHYDLPITDIAFLKKYNENEALLRNVNCLYLTISLGVFHNGWHSKLIAGILY